MAVQISDDGADFDPGSVPREERYGLAIMEERAQIVGAKLRLDSVPGRVTRVTVSMPAEAMKSGMVRVVSTGDDGERPRLP